MVTVYVYDPVTLKLVGVFSGSAPPEHSTAQVPDYTIGDALRFINGAWVDGSAGRHITGLAFRKRFTRGEKAAMEIAALDDPAADKAVRGKAAELRSDLKDNDAATYIDLDDERTRESVQNLEAVGLLDVGRAAEILDAPVQDVERYT